MKQPPQPPNERELFDRWIDLPEGSDLEAFLEEACTGDARLRDRMRALLKSSTMSAGVLPDAPSGWAVGSTMGVEEPGQEIGNYRLERIIGHGGFGVVWLATQMHPVRREVAMKILKPGLDTLAVLARFEAERQALAMMDHPNVAHVYDAGATLAGRPFFVMDYLDGKPLLAFADAHHLALPERLSLLEQVLAAVQHAHQKGIIHRDLKPSNILVVEIDGRPVPKVIDFGIAKTITAVPEAELTLAPGSWGTPGYMSPEQLAGEQVDTRTDIFSLGLILYELLSGSVAKRGGIDGAPEVSPSRCVAKLELGELERAAAARSVAPLQLGKALKGELDWIVQRAVAAEPEQRYESVAALGEDLARYRSGFPVVAGPPTKRYRAGKFVRRHRVKLAMASVVLCAMFAAVAVSLTYAGKARSATAAMADALYDARLTETRALRQSGRMGQRVNALAAAAAAAKIRPSAELRDEAIAAMALPDLEPIAALDVIPETRPVFDYDFESDLLVVGRWNRREIQRYRVVTGEELEPVPLPFRAAGSFKFCLSPGGKIIAVYPVPMLTGIANDVAFHEVETGRRICAVSGANFETLGCAYYDAGRKVLVPLKAGDLAEFDLVTGEEIRRIDTGGTVYQVGVNAAETQFVVCLNGSRQARIIDAATGATERVLTSHAPNSVAFSPDGRLLASGDSGGVVRVMSLANPPGPESSGIAELIGHRNYVSSVQFVLGGEFLVTSSWDNTVRLWNPTGSQLITLEGSFALVAPGGDRVLLSQGKRVLLLGLVRPEECTTFSHPTPSSGQGIAFSPDSSSAAISSNLGTMLVRMADGRVLASFGTRHHAASFAADGESLVTAGQDGLRAWDLRALTAAGATGIAHLLTDHSTVLDPEACVTFGVSADGAWLASAPSEGSGVRNISVVEESTGARLAELPWQAASLISLVFDPQGRWLAASYWRGEGFDVWETGAWKPLANPSRDVQSIQLAVHPTGSLLASCSATEVRLWDTSDWQVVRRLPCDFVAGTSQPVTFSPDGKILAYGYNLSQVKLVAVADGTVLATLTLPAQDQLGRLQFSPDQKTLGVSGTRSYFFHLERISDGVRDLGLPPVQLLPIEEKF